MIFAAHFGMYLLFVIGVLLFMATRWAWVGRFTVGCRAAAYGLVASFLGLALLSPSFSASNAYTLVIALPAVEASTLTLQHFRFC